MQNRKIRSLIFWVCAAAITAQPVSWGAQAGVQPPLNRPAASVRSADEMPLRFTNADINDFAVTMSELLGLKPMWVDPSVQGIVDLNVTMPRDLIFTLFNGILKTRNAVLVYDNNIYQIIPVAAAIRNNLEIIDEQPPPGADGPDRDIPRIPPAAALERETGDSGTLPIATHVVRLDFMSVDDVVEAVRLFVSESAAIITFKRLNMMIFTDYSDNAARVREIVRMLDNSFFNPDNVELVKIEYSNALDVAAELGVIFGTSVSAAPLTPAAAEGGRPASSSSSASSTGVSFVPIERLNSIFVMAASRHALDTAKRWIGELDAAENSKFQNYTYVVQNSTASNIASLLQALYGDGTGSTTTGTGRNTQEMSGFGANTNSSNSLINQAFGSQGRGNTFGSATQLGPRLDASSPTVTSVVLGGGEFSSLRDTARVVGDDVNNVLYVTSTPADYRSILSAVEEMDVPPRQVSIEAMVLQVSLTDDLAYGFRTWLGARTEGNMTTVGMGDGTNQNPTGLLSAQTFAFIGDQRQLNLEINALKSKNRVKILQQPSVTTMDGSPAKFMSGQEVPYTSGSYIVDNGSQTNVNYRPTGVSLEVVPKIAASGTVTMQIQQEVSSFSNVNVAGVSSPVFPSTNVQATLSVKDGQTAVIAGLVDSNDGWERAGLPLLSEIPVIGSLFGGTTKSNTRTELVILITPRIIGNPEKLQEFTQSFRDSLRNVRKLYDEQETGRIRDIEDARQDREKKELSDIRDIKRPKQTTGEQ